MRTLRSRLGILAALGILLTAFQVSPANAENIDQAPWSLRTGTSKSVTLSTPKFASTTGNASSCVKVRSLTDPGSTWGFREIWTSRHYTATGTHCSPKHNAGVRNPKFFLQISVYTSNRQAAVADGLWDIYTNF
jgi:hypothetical protein